MPISDKINDLRALMLQNKIDFYLIPTSDEFNNEYVPPAFMRLKWISGFSGSNGLAVIGEAECKLYTDGRYFIQAKQETEQCFVIVDIAIFDVSSFGKKRIGYDPKLHTFAQVQKWQQVNNGVELVPLVGNLIDQLWYNKPLHSFGNFYSYDNNAAIRITNVIAKMNPKADLVLLTAPDQLCWLMGIRGNDIPYNPIALLYGVLHRDGRVEYFLELEQLSKYLADLEDKFIQFDPHETSYALVSSIHPNKRIAQVSAIDALRLVKSADELITMMDAHINDGVALCEFFSWFEGESKVYSEFELSQKLLEFRSKRPNFHCPSFATICGYKENGALIHYQPSGENSKLVFGDGLLLIDSGGQYSTGGTTDVTRVIALGNINQIWRHHYTIVLKAHINLAMAIFPNGATGAQLDGIARQELWNNGMDYAHGTGHGVGVFLSVHEGPLRISKTCNYPLKANAILSNEPGFYIADHYGIRLENLVVVEQAHEDGFLAFNQLTQVPFARELIDLSMLTTSQYEWLVAYHASVLQNLSPLLSKSAKRWLVKACRL